MCNQTNNPINEVMKGYIKEVKRNNNQYDDREITDAHPLHQYIRSVIINNDVEIDPYKEIASVVFDVKWYNFHIFPQDFNKFTWLVKEFILVRNAILSFFEDSKYTAFFKTVIIVKGFGSKGIIKRLKDKGSNFFQKREGMNFNQDGLYKAIRVAKGGYCYDIVFMRYTCDENGNVGCTMPAFQFHKSPIDNVKISGNNIALKINDKLDEIDLKTLANGNCKIKIDAIDINKDNSGGFSISYPKTAEDGDIGENGTGNVCYNPPVSWPRYNKETKEYNATDIGEIIDSFIDFVEKENEI